MEGDGIVERMRERKKKRERGKKRWGKKKREIERKKGRGKGEKKEKRERGRRKFEKTMMRSLTDIAVSLSKMSLFQKENMIMSNEVFKIPISFVFP